MNANKGDVKATLPIGEDCRTLGFNPYTHTIFAANGDATLTVINQLNAARYQINTRVTTAPFAGVMALDYKRNCAYLCHAEMEDTADADGKTVKQPKAGTFELLTIGLK
jgi:hypothetical protein